MIQILAACLVATGLIALSTALVRPQRPLERRLAPYTQIERSLLGRDVDLDSVLRGGSGPASGAVLTGPLATGARHLVESGVDIAAPDVLTTRLRHAGFRDARPSTYRRLQVRTGVGGSVALGVALGGLAQLSGRPILISFLAGIVVGFPFGALTFRAWLDRQAAQRARRLQLEVYSVALVLSARSRHGRGPLLAFREVAARGTGELCAHLSQGVHWMQRGAGVVDTMERLAVESPDPTTARLIRLVGSAAVNGHDPSGPLRDFARQLRLQRAEQLDQAATRRRAAMLIPMLLFMFPVILLFALAPGPSIVLGK